MMKLVKNLKSLDEYVTARQDNKVYFKGELCFFKTGDSLLLLNELVAEELAKDFKIPCAHYEIGTLKDKPVVLSKSVFEKNAVFYSLFNLIEYDIDLETIWNELDRKYKDYDLVAKLMEEIVKVFLFDILIANGDRHGLNLFIEESAKGIQVAPIFDNENMLSELSISHQMYILNKEYASPMPTNNVAYAASIAKSVLVFIFTSIILNKFYYIVNIYILARFFTSKFKFYKSFINFFTNCNSNWNPY